MEQRECSICGDDPICTMDAFSDRIFIDGKKHEVICHRCFSTLLSYEHLNNTVICYKHLSPYYLNDVKTMMKYGWSEEESRFSIKAMNKCLDKVLKAAPFGNSHFLELLYLGSEVELDGWPNEIKLIIN